MPKGHREFWSRYYAALKGAKIIDAGIGDDGFPYFEAQKNGEVFLCEVSQDAEGNGPGFLFGLPKPKVRKKNG